MGQRLKLVDEPKVLGIELGPQVLLELGKTFDLPVLDDALVGPHVHVVAPALVLVGIYAGASVCGVPGMLFALPMMMAMRTVFRVFVQKCENI